MDSVERHIVPAMYAAAVDPARWPAALCGIAAIAEARSALCFVLDNSGAIREVLQHGFEDNRMDVYRHHYAGLDPARELLERLPRGTMHPMHRHLSDRTVSRSEYFQDFYIPSGHRFSCGGTIVAGGRRLILAVHRTQDRGPYERGTLARLQRILEHLPGVFEVRSVVQRRDGLASLQSSALMSIARPIFVTDREARVEFLNSAAEALVRRGDSMQLTANRLSLRDASESAHFRRAIIGACATAQEAHVVPMHTRAADGSLALEVQIAPLAPSLPQDAAPDIPRALVLVRRLFCAEGWDRLAKPPFDLTGAEFQLVAGLTRGLTPDECADERHVSITTIRSQIRAVLDKTSTRRISELVGLFAPLEVADPRDAATARGKQ